MSQRQTRVAEQVRHVIASALLRGDVPSTINPRELTVVQVWVSADLRLARVFVQTHQDADAEALIEAANVQLARPLRKILAVQARLKNTPEITFFPAE